MQSDPPDAADQPRSSTIEGYELGAELAQGALATVHLASTHNSDGMSSRVVIKRARPALAAISGWQDLLHQEAELLEQVRHANVVAKRDAGVVDVPRGGGQHYLVLEYIEGDSLASLLRRDAPPPSAAVLAAIFADALRGLVAVHTAVGDDGQPLGIVHQAPHAGHLLVGVDGVTRLIDFTQARARLIAPSSYVTQRLVVANMAPEQVLSDDTVDHRADLFVLATSLWESLTGERLFAGKSDQEAIHNVLQCRVAKPSTVGLRPPPMFDELLLRALRADRDARFGSAEELRTQLLTAARAAGGLATRAEVARWARTTAARAARRPSVSANTLFDTSYQLHASRGDSTEHASSTTQLDMVGPRSTAPAASTASERPARSNSPKQTQEIFLSSLPAVHARPDSSQPSARAPSSQSPARTPSPPPPVPLADASEPRTPSPSSLPAQPEARAAAPASAAKASLNRTLIGASFADISNTSSAPDKPKNFANTLNYADGASVRAAVAQGSVRPPPEHDAMRPPAPDSREAHDEPASAQTTPRELARFESVPPRPSLDRSTLAPVDASSPLKLWASTIGLVVLILVLGDLLLSGVFPWPASNALAELSSLPRVTTPVGGRPAAVLAPVVAAPAVSAPTAEPPSSAAAAAAPSEPPLRPTASARPLARAPASLRNTQPPSSTRAPSIAPSPLKNPAPLRTVAAEEATGPLPLNPY